MYVAFLLDFRAVADNFSAEKKNGNKTTKIISNVVAVLSIVITFWALWYIYKEMVRVKPIVFRERRLARYAIPYAVSCDADTNIADLRSSMLRLRPLQNAMVILIRVRQRLGGLTSTC